jgi:hypothetical protein
MSNDIADQYLQQFEDRICKSMQRRAKLIATLEVAQWDTGRQFNGEKWYKVPWLRSDRMGNRWILGLLVDLRDDGKGLHLQVTEHHEENLFTFLFPWARDYHAEVFTGNPLKPEKTLCRSCSVTTCLRSCEEYIKGNTQHK